MEKKKNNELLILSGSFLVHVVIMDYLLGSFKPNPPQLIQVYNFPFSKSTPLHKPSFFTPQQSLRLPALSLILLNQSKD